MHAEYISHVGAVRDNNEDAVCCDIKNGLFVVADGIGGREAGEIASATAVHIVAQKAWSEPDEEPEDMLRGAFYEANNFIYRKGRLPGMEGMGTTMTAAVIRDDDITIVHIGDSRAYLINKKEIRQLTQDHSLVAQLVRAGHLTPEEARNHPRKNILLKAIGQGSLADIDTIKLKWGPGDYLLLCSDGLYNLVEEKEMQETTLRMSQLQTTVEILARSAYDRGGYDNISLILISHE